MNHLFAAYTFNKIPDNEGSHFSARPQRHWRKQYQNQLGYSRASAGMPMDRPGGLVPVASTNIQCKTCRGAFKTKVILNKDSPCTSCEPIKNKVSLTDTRYTNVTAYLQARGLTYQQNLYPGLIGQKNILPGPLNECSNAGSQY